MPKDAKLPLWAEKSTDQKLDALRDMIEELFGYVLRDDLEKVTALLEQYKSLDDDPEEKDQDQQHLNAIMVNLYRYPSLFNRSCETAHLVGSGLIINLNSGKILLHRHKKLGTWLQFGGHSRYETDFAQVALREAMEESGLKDLKYFPDENNPQLIDVDVHTIAERGTVPEHQHLDMRFLFSTRTNPDQVVGEEATEARANSPTSAISGIPEGNDFEWLDFDEALVRPMLVPNVKPLIKKAKKAYLAYLASQNKPSGT